MITTGKPIFNVIAQYNLIVNSFLLVLGGLYFIMLRYLLREIEKIYVKLELFRRGHIDHTQDDLDRFIEEYKKKLK